MTAGSSLSAAPGAPREVPPLRADPEAVRSFALALLAVSAQLDDLGAFVAGPGRVADWSGLAAGSYHAGIRSIGQRADAMSLGLREVGHRAHAHADELAKLLSRRDLLLAERVALAHLLDGLAGGADPEPVAERLGRYHADLACWERDCGTEDRAMVDAFRGALTWERVAARWAGVTDTADAALAAIPDSAAPPGAVHGWWASLPPVARLAIVAAAPGTIGSRPGLPARVRHLANMIALERDLADWRSLAPDRRTDEEQRWMENAVAAREALDRVADGIDPVTGEPTVPTLLLYDPRAFEGDGRVAIGVGDLDTADHVAVVVPGLGTDGGSASAQADRALTLYESTRYLHAESVATLAWIGYDAPDNVLDDHDWVGVVGERMADEGGERLADSLDGLRAARPGDPAHQTVVGNSYGSTTTGHGATDHGLAVDDVVLAGSPGAGDAADHASDLGVGAGHVWVATSSHDPIAGLADSGWLGGATFGGAGLGDDPAEDDFGARRMRAESVTRGTGLDPFADHGAYFDHGTESLANISHVVAGAYDQVTSAGHVHDPWYAGPQDPEEDRAPTTVTTRRP
jgi:hypothetical protein